MATFGTYRNGVIELDPGTGVIQEGTRVEVSLVSGMEPLIRKTPGVNGGDACIGNRRIAVWMLNEYRRQGVRDADLMERSRASRPTNSPRRGPMR